MTKKIKSKSGLNIKSKILVLGLILVVLAGLFGGAARVNAQTTGACYYGQDDAFGHKKGDLVLPALSQEQCGLNTQYYWQETGASVPSTPITAYQNCINNGGTPDECKALSGAPKSANQTAFEVEINKNQCGIGGVGGTLWPGCFIQATYGLFYVIPSFILWLSAYLFNVLIFITLSGTLLTGAFVPEAWGIVRDLSNIFFILILLYVAFKIILGLGGHEAKKMIMKVIIIALLINFSMFFTKVIIDSSNVLALIFYNKVQVDTKNADGTPRPYASATGEKDAAGGLVNAFNPTRLLTPEFFAEAGKQTIPGFSTIEGPVPPGILIGITIIAGLLMFFAAYALFVSGFSFLGRLIELFVLIIFSPFAFVSSTMPKLGGIEYIGWDAWFKRLIKTSFMAPIFMFFLYFIFLLVHSKIFDGLVNKTNTGFIGIILLIVIPAMVILVLLLKATEFAKKGSGKFGEVLTKAGGQIGGLATGLALGAATGGAAVVGRATIGRAGAALAESEWAKQREREGKFGSRVFTKVAGGIGAGSFDVRGVKVAGQTLAGATGIPMGETQKGGFTERKKAAIENRVKRAKELQVGENDPLKKALNRTEMDLQGLLGANTAAIEGLDKLIEKKRQEVGDANNKLNAAKNKYDSLKGTGTSAEAAAKLALDSAQTNMDDRNDELDKAKDNKKKLRTGLAYTDHNGVAQAAAVGASGSIDNLEKLQKTQAQAIKTKNVLSNQQYAAASQKGGVRAINFILTGGAYTKAAAGEAAHKIVMETKLDSGTKS